MHHHIAFLRGINLGRRRMKMDQLRTLFEAMRFAQVATFIASGNVIFSSRNGDRRKLEQQIQAHLKVALGYEVDTFVRTREEVVAVANFEPFAKVDMANPSSTMSVGFLREPLSTEQARRFSACRTAADEFCVNGREYYWLCRIKTNESKVWASSAMRSVGLPTSSMRNLTTVRKLAALYPPPSD